MLGGYNKDTFCNAAATYQAGIVRFFLLTGMPLDTVCGEGYTVSIPLWRSDRLEPILIRPRKQQENFPPRIKSVDELIALLDDPNDVLRAEAIQSLAWSNSPKLYEAYESTSSRTRLGVMLAISKFPERPASTYDISDEALNTLHQGLKDEDADVRIGALNALARLRKRRFLDVAILTDKKSPDEDVVASLLNDSEPRVRAAAFEALEAIITADSMKDISKKLPSSKETKSIALSADGKWKVYSISGLVILEDVEKEKRRVVYPLEKQIPMEKFIEDVWISDNGEKIWFAESCPALECYDLWLYQRLTEKTIAIDPKIPIELSFALEPNYGWIAQADYPWSVLETTQELEEQKKLWKKTKRPIYIINLVNGREIELGKFSGDLTRLKWDGLKLKISESQVVDASHLVKQLNE